MKPLKLVIRSINAHLFDVFWADEGWNDWARIQRNDRGFLTKTLGEEVPRAIFAELINMFNRKKV